MDFDASEEECKSEYMKFIKNMNSQYEEDKSDRGKFDNYDIKKLYHLELYLTSEQLIKIGHILLTFDGKSKING